MQTLKVILMLPLITLLVGGCASSKSGSVYTREQARQAQQVEKGRIISVREVQVEGTKTPLGAVGGAAVGAIAGSTVGGGKGSEIAAIAGGLGGWLAGAAAEEVITRQNALEITVELDNGRTISVVQAENNLTFQPGERVHVLSSPTATRISKISN